MKSMYRGMGDDYARIEQAILYLDQNYQDQPSLEELAQRVHLSKFHFQRMFTRWAGISPKRFIPVLRLGEQALQRPNCAATGPRPCFFQADRIFHSALR